MSKLAVVALILFLAEVAPAQIPTSGNLFFGYSYYNTNLTGGRSSLNGWEGSVEGKVLPFIGIVGDFSGHYGSENFTVCTVPILDCVIFNADVSQHNYLFGPRVSVSAGKIRPFAEVMIGAAHVNAHTIGSDTSFATAVGGGLDYKVIKLVAWRFQGEYVHSHLFNSAQNNVRLSTGIVLRF
jgi:opacity protein-like surface antigen